MGTRSVIAEPQGDSWRGRYAHWDGYPEGVGATLWEIVQRDGLEKAHQVLLYDTYGWASVTGEDDPELGIGYTDGRFKAVPGYGIGYTTEQGQSSDDDWIEATGDDWGTEWAYILADDGLHVLKRVYGDGTPAVGFFGATAAPEGSWKGIETVRWDEDEPDWGAIEAKVYGEEVDA